MNTQKVFKVAIITIRTWENKLKEEGTLKKKPVIRLFRKLDPEKLKIYLEDLLTRIYVKLRQNLAVAKQPYQTPAGN